MSGTTLTERPFKGLMPYEEADALFFFGREADCYIITSTLMASRLTILYGPSGVGKSSVLDAGVVHHVRQLAQDNLKEIGKPEFAIVVHRSWYDDPVAGLLAGVQHSVEQALGHPFDPVPLGTTLADALAIWAARLNGTLLIILDQFEDYFRYHPREDGEGTFAVEFPQAVNRPDLRVNFLVSLRDDALEMLDRFEGRIMSLFNNNLRIGYLNSDAARDAIVKPIEQYNKAHAAEGQPVKYEPELIGAILEEIKTSEGELATTGRANITQGVKAPDRGDDTIKTWYLQLVMTELWKEEHRLGSRTLRLSTLLGGKGDIWWRHLDNVLKDLKPEEQEVCSQLFEHLVTPGGKKAPCTEGVLVNYVTEGLRKLLPSVLETLTDAWILRRRVAWFTEGYVIFYEIFHDVLGLAIVSWRTRYQIKQTGCRRSNQVKRESLMATDSESSIPSLEWHAAKVIKEMLGGRVTLFLGAGANLCDRPTGVKCSPGSRFLPSGWELTEYLARESRYLHTPDDLLRVTRYVTITDGAGPLYEELRKLFDSSHTYTPTCLHRFLAAFPSAMRAKGLPVKYPLIVTTNYDDVLEVAFKQAYEPYDLVYYEPKGEYLGKFWHRPPDGKTQLIERPNKYHGLLHNQRTIVLKIHGAVTGTGTEPTGDLFTGVTDFLFLLPVPLPEKLMRSHYLFLGYGMRDWKIRAILRRIWKDQTLRWKSWSVKLDRDAIDDQFWREKNVDIINVGLQDYIVALNRCLENWPHAGGGA